MPFKLDQMLSHYRLLEKIGEGGMGVVYVAWDTTLKRKVALKVLLEALATDPARLERFHREAEMVAALNHPCIVTIHSVEESDGTRFLTMELVDGESLDHVVAAGPLPVPRVLDIGIALADALSAAHERGIVHRDLKPANVMLTRDGRVKVLDFGLAKLAEPASEDWSQMATRRTPLTREGGVLGTAPYMAPEQLRGEPVDHRTDLFSLGVVLYELATGRRPFAGKNAAEIVSSILRDTPAPVTQTREDVPRQLGRIIIHCLQKGLRERFQSARDVRNELRELREELKLGAWAAPAPSGASQAKPSMNVTASPVSQTGSVAGPIRTPRPGMRSLWILLAGAGLLIAAGTAVVWSVRSERGSMPGAGAEKTADASPAASRSKVASIAVLPFVNMSGDADNEYFSDGLAEELLNALAKNPSLRVAARTSSFSFKGKEVDIAEIGRRLNVASIVEGSVRKQGDQVRITVQLISAADGYHIWSETYDRRLEKIFEVQDDITRSVMTSLQANLPAAGTAGQRAGNIEAYNLRLRADYFWWRSNPGDLERARDLYKQALALEPGDGRAWLMLGWTYINMVGSGTLSPEEASRLARDATERALALDDSQAGAHAQFGFQKMFFDWNWTGAEAELNKARALDPRDIAVFLTTAQLASVQGRLEDASELLRQYLEIDPLNKLALGISASTFLAEGRLDEALVNARMLLDLDAKREGAHALAGLVLLAQNKTDAALQEFLQETSQPFRQYGLVLVYHVLGRRADSDGALAEYAKLKDASAYQIACLHAVRGEVDKAFASLDRAYVKREPYLWALKTDPDLANLRGDPRWPPILRKMRLAD